jgi:hypothetical protein
MSDRPQDVPLDFWEKPARLLFSSHRQTTEEIIQRQLRLFPFEVMVSELL